MSDNPVPDFLSDPFVTAAPEHLPFWQAAEDGRLLLPRCNGCGRHHWTPRPVCPFCHGSAITWEPASGRGRIHACSTLRRADPPYTVAYVELDEGPRMLTNLIGMDDAAMQIGTPVQVVFRRTEEGRMAPKFTGLPPGHPRTNPTTPEGDAT